MPKLANVCLSERSYPVLCDPGEFDLRTYDFCVIAPPEGVSGEGITEVAGFIKGFEYLCDHQVKDREIPKILRKATSKDVRAWHFLKRRENEAIGICKEKVVKHNLPMKISSVRFDDRQRKISFNFTADKRVDFRELVKDLAATFKARIELWQIGVRDETRDLGGFGVCGRQLCCCAWLKVFAPVSIRYAKTQDIQFSPTKLSGGCGRLRCCLAFEQQQYIEMGKDAPPIGSIVRTAEYGESRVVDRNLIRRTASIQDSDGKINVIPFSKIKDIKVTKEVEKANEQIVLDPDETPEEATALLEEEKVVIVTPNRAAQQPADDPANLLSQRTLAQTASKDPRSPIVPNLADDEDPGEEENQNSSSEQAGQADDRNQQRRRGKRGGRNRNSRPDRPRGEQQAGEPSAGQNAERRSPHGGNGEGNRPPRNNQNNRRDFRNNRNRNSSNNPNPQRRPSGQAEQ